MGRWLMAAAAALLLDWLVLARFFLLRPRLLPALICLAGLEAGPDRGAAVGLFGGLLSTLAGASPWQPVLLTGLGALGGGLSNRGGFGANWGRAWLALGAMEAAVFLGRWLQGDGVIGPLRLALPALVLDGLGVPAVALARQILRNLRRGGRIRWAKSRKED